MSKKETYKILFVSILFMSTSTLLALFSKPKSPEIYAEEQIQLPGINEELIDENNDIEILSPNYGDVLEYDKFTISWENKNPENKYYYSIYFYYCEGQFHMGSTYRLTEENSIVITPYQEGVIALQIYYYDIDMYYTEKRKDFTHVSEILVLGIGMDIPEFWFKRYYKEKKVEEMPTVTLPPIEEEKAKIEVVVIEDTVEKKKYIQKPKPKAKPKNKQEEYIREVLEWNLSPPRAVKGISSEDVNCKYKFIKGKKTVKEVVCNIPKLSKLNSYKENRGHYKNLVVTGNIKKDIQVQVDIYICKREFLKPKSFFKCNEQYQESKYYKITPNNFFSMVVDNRNVKINGFGIEGEKFFLFSETSLTQEALSAKLTHLTSFSLPEFSIEHSNSTDYRLEVKEVIEDENKKPFVLPFKRSVGVTQWHGYTAFQKPHTGIDFGVANEQTNAIGDGIIVGKGWDSYYGECLSGGNYLTVKHKNGMHSAYFHLTESFVNIGDSVKKEQLVAQTGNSGAWNCQPLAQHLHFEIRENRLQSSHVDPVKYIEANWNEIPTLGYQRYPGRLTGDNPHPGR